MTRYGANRGGGSGTKASGRQTTEPPTYCKEDVQKAKEAFRNNKDFREFFHRKYKPSQKSTSNEKSNPDLGDQAIADAFDEFNSQ
jgi:hypothetical protein